MKSKLIFLVTGFWLLVTLTGCEAFVRKFTRKPKTPEVPEQEMILAPEEYKGLEMTPGEQYQEYFLFWKTWQDEFIVSLQENRSPKKQIDCLKQAIGNLENLRPLLKEELHQTLDGYIQQEQKLLESIRGRIYGSSFSGDVSLAESLKRNILRDFSYKKIEEYLIGQP